METQTLRTELWWQLTVGRESNMETYITVNKIDSQWKFAVWLRELKLGLNNNLEGWDGERGERDVQVWGDMGEPMADSCWLLEGSCQERQGKPIPPYLLFRKSPCLHFLKILLSSSSPGTMKSRLLFEGKKREIEQILKIRRNRTYSPRISTGWTLLGMLIMRAYFLKTSEHI